MRSFLAALATAGTVVALLPVGPQAAATPPGPDGDVVFAATHDAPIHGVYVVNPANATPTVDRVEEGNYTDSPTGGIGPAFSKGGLLAMSLQNDAGKARIQIGTRTYKTDNTTLATVATSHVADYDPAWRPDGNLLAFTGVVADTGGVSRIAYDHAGDIWTMATDGSDKKRLTTTGGNGAPAQDPTWKPDGTALAFDTFSNGGQHLAMVNSDGSGFTLLAPSVDGSAPVWSPDGTKLAFDSFSGDSSTINVLTVSTGHVDQVTTPVTGRLDLYPSWSPNGNKLVFERFDEQSGSATIYFVPAAGGSLTQLTGGHHPSWSPDGSTIVYTKPTGANDTNFDIYTVPVAGGTPERLTTNSADDYEPTWSHNGNKILFSSVRDSDGDVFVMNADGSSETKLTSNVGHYTNNGQQAPDGQAVWGPPVASTKSYIFTAKPDGTDVQRVTNAITGGNAAWSPDGSRIAFSDKNRIFTIGPTGLGLAPVTTSATPTTDDADPSYSPDGTRIAFSGGQAGGDRYVYAIGTDGRGLAKIVGSTGDKDRSPVWSPTGKSLAFVNHDVFTVAADGTGQHQLTSLAATDTAQSADWGSTGPPDTVINSGPSGTIGARDVKFVFSSSRAPSTFQCKLQGQAGLSGLHDWSACGSGSSGTKSYTDLDAGTYTFLVRASNSVGTDATPASSQFSTAPPGVTVVLEGQGGGTVKSIPTGINCSPSKPDCTHVFKGTVTLVAKANGLSVFKGWSGDCTGKSACEVKAQNESKTVYAKFELSGDDPPQCSNGPSSIKTVGDWQAKGCWQRKGSGFTTDETVELNGLFVYPDGQLELDGGTLSATGGPATLLTPTAHSGGSKISPVVLDQGRLSYNLRGNAPIAAAVSGHRARPAITLDAPDVNFLGLPLRGDSISLTAKSAGATEIGGTVVMPDILNQAKATLSFVTEEGKGMHVGTIGVDNINASVANMFALNNGSLSYSDDVWSARGTISMPGGTGTFSGLLGYAGGTLNTADLELSDVTVGGFLDNAGVEFHLSSGRWTAGATLHGVRLVGGLSFANHTLSSLSLEGNGINAFGFVGIDAFSFSYDAATGWNASGTVKGQNSGSFKASMTYKDGVLTTAGIKVTSVKIGDVFSLDQLNLDYENGKDATKWAGGAVLGGANGGRVIARFTLKGGHLTGGSIALPDLPLFGLIDIKNFVMGINDVGGSACGTQETSWGVSGTVSSLGGSFDVDAGMGFDKAGVLKCGRFKIAKTKLGGVLDINNLSIDFTSQATWTGIADVVFPGGLGIQANVAFKDGQLTQLGGGIHAPGPGIPLGTSGIFVQGGTLGFKTQPQFSVNGSIDLSAGPKVPVINVQALGVNGSLELRFANATQPWGMTVVGTGTLGNFAITQVGVKYDYPSSLTVQACLGKCDEGINIANGFATLKAQLNGGIRGLSTWEVDGTASATFHFKGCIPNTVICFAKDVGVEGKATVSNAGVAACGHVQGMSDDWSAGFGYKWGQTPGAFTGCDLGAYETIGLAPHAALRPTYLGHGDFRAAADPAPVTVAADSPVQAFRFVGATTSPSVTLHGPKGEVIDANPDTVGVADGHLIEMDPRTKSTYIVVDHPSAGQWTTTLDADSHSALDKSAAAASLPQPDVTATVGGTGLQRTLDWKLTPIPGQTVRFVEKGTDSTKVITTTSAATGTVSFAPAPGSAGTRTIVAEISQNGVPRKTVDVASYDAPARTVVQVLKRGAGSGAVSGLAGKISCGALCAADITPGQSMTFTATPAKGSRFMGWDGACAGLQRTCTIALDNSDAVTAVFDRIRRPTIARLGPTSGKRGSMVTLHGVGFLGASKVAFGKVRAGEVAVISDTEIRVVVPATAKTSRIKVTGPGGTGRTAGKFVVKKG